MEIERISRVDLLTCSSGVWMQLRSQDPSIAPEIQILHVTMAPIRRRLLLLRNRSVSTADVTSTAKQPTYKVNTAMHKELQNVAAVQRVIAKSEFARCFGDDIPAHLANKMLGFCVAHGHEIEEDCVWPQVQAHMQNHDDITADNCVESEEGKVQDIRVGEGDVQVEEGDVQVQVQVEEGNVQVQEGDVQVEEGNVQVQVQEGDVQVEEAVVQHLKSDSPRGRRFLSEIKSLRAKRGLYRSFEVVEGDVLHRFTAYLAHRRQLTSHACALNRLLFWLHEKAGKKATNIDVSLLLNFAWLDEYINILAYDLDGSNRSIGLLPSSIKNVVACLPLFISFLRMNAKEFTQLHSDDLSRLEIWLKERYTIISKDKAKHSVAVKIQRAMSGQRLTPQMLHRATTNARVNKKLLTLRHKYKNTQCQQQNDYNFLTKYIANAATLTCFQRSGVIGGLTLNEFKERKAVKVDERDHFAILVAKHKTGNARPAILLLSAELVDDMLLYLKHFRPSGSPCKQFLLTQNGRPFSNPAKYMLLFHQQWGLQHVTGTEARAYFDQMHATIEQQKRAEMQRLNVAPTDSTSITNHSRATAANYYMDELLITTAVNTMTSYRKFVRENHTESDDVSEKENEDAEDDTCNEQTNKATVLTRKQFNAALFERHPVNVWGKCPSRKEALLVAHTDHRFPRDTPSVHRALMRWREHQITLRARQLRRENPLLSSQSAEQVAKFIQRRHPAWAEKKLIRSEGRDAERKAAALSQLAAIDCSFLFCDSSDVIVTRPQSPIAREHISERARANEQHKVNIPTQRPHTATDAMYNGLTPSSDHDDDAIAEYCQRSTDDQRSHPMSSPLQFTKKSAKDKFMLSDRCKTLG
ncbi:hypothetical protein CAPTEDRAFT_190790 [Capitella teleta]|uniref:Uncharacterized protein n=1 Tax=Capitella teleta TaxID=283909 RepID=R7TWM2_CAPTE|nr:hypothetical protein CAPTEDRAFT_190790 [Capitella teleta]|eukprot:ELT95375.1 hypothetical protein CAPTEDRAFT_190790 [Capitella teleta]